jgi:hypothetical protein
MNRRRKVDKMRRFTGAIAIMTLTVLLGSVSDSALAAGDGKGARSPRATNAGGQGSGKSVWSADPERGWVRTNERRSESDDSVQRGKPDNGKKKSKGKPKKS